MHQAKKVEYITKTLAKLYPNPNVPLDHQDDYTLLIAVMLSAQCTDVRVNTITPKLFAKANHPKAMVQLGESAILEIIRPCGLGPAKAKNILNTSKILWEVYDSKVPSTLEELEKLPGVGHKTASVMMIQAFHTPAFPVDTHIHRLLTRWGITSGHSVAQTEKDAKKVFKPETWAKLHLQIIFYGREYCPARGHDLNKCLICKKIQSGA